MTGGAGAPAASEVQRPVDGSIDGSGYGPADGPGDESAALASREVADGAADDTGDGPIGARARRAGVARTRVKICGITRVEDALAACAAGADAIGLNFYAPSPRSVDVDQAAAIRERLPPFVTVVGLFVNEDEEVVVRTAARVALDCLQFHGNESPSECQRYGMPYLKAVRMGPGVDVAEMARSFAGAQALVLDTHDDKLWGGSGRTFDWDSVPTDIGLPLIIAGGLTPANVAEAVARLRPYGVDVSGGVERAPGIKDAASIEKFIREVDRVTFAERAG